MQIKTNAELAAFLGLTDLDTITNDPDDLHGRSALVRSIIRHLRSDAPLRLKTGFAEYRDRCDALLERVVEET